MNEWQPIETAPKDGTEILVFVPFVTGPAIVVVHWTDDGSSTRDDFEDEPDGEGWTEPHDGYVGMWDDASHWMPLPKPPSSHSDTTE